MTAPAPMSGQPLLGCTVLVTAERRAAELSAALERRGAAVVHAPVMSIVPHVDDEHLLAATRALLHAPPDVVVVTTGIGLRGWLEAADAAGLAAELLDVLASARIVARGPKARGAIQAAGLTADWVAESETSAEIRDLLLTEGVAGLRVAVQHHGSGSDGLDGDLAAAGAQVQPLVVYRWGPTPRPEAVEAGLRQVCRHQVDAVAFTSAPGVAAFVEAAEKLGVRDEVVAAFTASHGVLAAAVGPVTAAPLRDLGVEPVVPDRARLGALVRTLTHAIAEQHAHEITTPAGTLRVLRSAATLDGEVLALSPSSLAVLRLLVAADGAVVPRRAVLDALPGGSDDAHAADVAVARLRESLGRRDLVRTAVKRGYSLTVDGRIDGEKLTSRPQRTTR